MLVLAGKGAGQWRRVVDRSGPKGLERVWVVDQAWTVTPDTSSQLQIAPLRGHVLLAENSWTTAYTVQLYGMCLDTVVVNNRFANTPFYVWGRNPHDWGYQPNWNVEVLGNVLPNSKGITTLSCDQKFNLCDEGVNPATGKVAFNGPLNSAIAIRGNMLAHGQGLTIHGTTSDTIAEWNFVHLGSGAFSKYTWTCLGFLATCTGKIHARSIYDCDGAFKTLFHCRAAVDINTYVGLYARVVSFFICCGTCAVKDPVIVDGNHTEHLFIQNNGHDA